MTALLTLEEVTGELRLGHQAVTITCRISVEEDGRVSLRTTPMPLATATAWLLERATSHDQGFLPWWSLIASSREGDEVSSEHLTLYKHTLAPLEQGNTIALELQASRMTITSGSVTNAADCNVTYHTIGMHGDGVQRATAPEGTINLAGAARPSNQEHLIGYLQISAHKDEQRPLTEWLDACDERAQHVLRIISLADGKNLVWSIRQTKKDEQIIATELYGRRHAGPGRGQIFSPFDLQPILDLAVTNYSPELREQTGIDTAISFFLITSPHIEVQLLIAMAAIEHLTSIHKAHHPVSTPLPCEVFAKVKEDLTRTYDLATASFTIDEKSAKRVRDKIGTLNQTTFHDDLGSMLQQYKVPAGDLSDRVKRARQARNDIAHRGTCDLDFRAFYDHVRVLQELLTRIFLTLLEYEGKYQSFLDGPSWRRFPPTMT
jgi:hypothetical protein